MRARFIYISIAVVVCGIAGGLLGAAQEADLAPWLTIALTVVFFLVFMAVGIGAMILRRRTERRELTAAADSFERLAAVKAQSKAFLDTLILTVIAGCVFIIFPTQTNPAWVLIGMVIVLVADFWVRYTVMTKGASKASV